MTLQKSMVALAAGSAMVFGGEAALAHDAPLEQIERASAVTERATITGTVHEVVVDDAVHGSSVRYVEMELDDGSLVALDDGVASALTTGERVQVTGRIDGRSVRVETAQKLAAAGPSTKAESEIEGTLAVLHADDFARGRSEFVYVLHPANGGVRRLRLARLPAELKPGAKLRVVGRVEADGESITPSRITIVAAPATTSTTTGVVAKAATASSALVIMANFANTALPSYTVAQAQQVMTSNADSVANFFREVSYGQQLLNVSVTPAWVTMNLAQPTTCSSSDWQAIGSAAESAARSLGSAYDPTAYNYVVYLFPNVPACGWVGLAYIGSPHKVWINGVGGFKTVAIAHEMGHNFGLLHAASVRCSGGSIVGSCSVSEYGDPFDAMGNQRAMHYNATQKAKLAWIPSGSVKTHSGGAATYTLSPLEVAGGATYAVKIPTVSANRTYWLEYRQPVGFDSPLSAYPNNGAQVRVASPFETLCSGCDSWSDDTQLLDMTLGTSAFTDAALVSGQTFTDPTYGINVIVVSASASALTVQVSTGGAPPPTMTATSTTLAASPNPSLTGATVTFTASVTGNAPNGSVSFADSGSPIGGCSAIALAGSGNVRTASCTTNALAAGTHSVVASYSGNSANAASVSPSVSELVNGSMIDHYYWAILGRAPDPSGTAFWASQVTQMQALGVDVKEVYRVMAIQFFNSREYSSLATSNTQYVSDLYETFFTRAPDASGLAYWTGQLASGLPRSVVLLSFLFSTEFSTYMNGLLGTSTSRAATYAVVDFYRGLLNRLPDATGFSYWVGRLHAAQCSVGNVADAVYATIDAISSQFVASSEYAARQRDNAGFVSDFYNAFLRRGGSASDIAFWVQRLDAGIEDRQAMRSDFQNSQEFSARMSAIVQEGC